MGSLKLLIGLHQPGDKLFLAADHPGQQGAAVLGQGPCQKASRSTPAAWVPAQMARLSPA